jgi:hypothetical protein
MPITRDIQKLCCTIELTEHECAIPREDGDIGDRIVVIAKKSSIGKTLIEYI